MGSVFNFFLTYNYSLFWRHISTMRVSMWFIRINIVTVKILISKYLYKQVLVVRYFSY